MWGENMRVAVASEGKDESSKVSEVSGRAAYYLLFDDGKLNKVIRNPFAVGGGGSGLSVVRMLENEDVDKVISGRFGPKMKEALESAKIGYVETKEEKVAEVLRDV